VCTSWNLLPDDASPDKRVLSQQKPDTLSDSTIENSKDISLEDILQPLEEVDSFLPIDPKITSIISEMLYAFMKL
jgi:hypothetical protein